MAADAVARRDETKEGRGRDGRRSLSATWAAAAAAAAQHAGGPQEEIAGPMRADPNAINHRFWKGYNVKCPVG